jgi:hypothetical protein
LYCIFLRGIGFGPELEYPVIMVKMHWSEKLPSNACESAVAWARTQESLAQAWVNCTRGDWMLWLLGKNVGEPGSEDRKPFALACAECARLALPFVKGGEFRPVRCIETLESWARNEGATLDDVRDAAVAANAANAANAAVAAVAAYAANAANAAVAANADAVAANADAVAANAAKGDTLSKCADIVRAHYPKGPRL